MVIFHKVGLVRRVWLALQCLFLWWSWFSKLFTSKESNQKRIKLNITHTHTHTHKKQPSINHDLLYFGINQIRSQPTGLKTSNLNDNKIKTNSLHLQQYKYANVRQKKKKKKPYEQKTQLILKLWTIKNWVHQIKVSRLIKYKEYVLNIPEMCMIVHRW